MSGWKPPARLEFPLVIKGGCGDEYEIDRITYTLDLDGGTRWHKLFGTPEKVADYFATQCMGGDGYTCEICPFADCNGGLHVAPHPTIRNELLEWLKGGAK